MKRAPGTGPLAAVRAAIERENQTLLAALRSHATEVEARLKEAEDRTWRLEREVGELEGYLSRAAAIVGVELGDPREDRPDWSKVVAGINAAVERASAAPLEAGRLRQALERSETVVGKAATHTATLSRVAARLGLSTLNATDLLRAIDALVARARRG